MKRKKRKSEGKGQLMGVVEGIIGSDDHEIQRGATTLRNSPSLRHSPWSLSLKPMGFSPKMLFGNLIMICRQRLCFSAWLKNRGFRVREI